MKIIRKIFFVLFVATLFISCNVSNEKKVDSIEIEVNKEEAKNLTNLEVEITGMTCEIGCARTIQSKLSKTEGVKFAEINFEKKNGIVEYDANKVSEKDIVNVVEQIAGGDLYKVTDVDKAE